MYVKGKAHTKRKLVKGSVGLVFPGIWYSRGKFMTPAAALFKLDALSPKL
jgi:hypothetical protein